MSAAAALLAEVRGRGVELRANGNRLEFRPVSAVPPDLRAKLAEYKADLIRLLTTTATTPTAPDPVCTLVFDPALDALVRADAERRERDAVRFSVTMKPNCDPSATTPIDPRFTIPDGGRMPGKPS